MSSFIMLRRYQPYQLYFILINCKIAMLKFLDDKQPAKQCPLIKYVPELVYGHTQESPPEMTNKYTIFYRSESKKLPQIEYTGNKRLPPSVKQQFNVSKQQVRGTSRQKPNKANQVTSNQPFNLTQGEFTSFLDRHKHYSSIGTIYKQSNKQQSYRNTTSYRSSWNKSINADSKSITGSVFSKRTSIPSNNSIAVNSSMADQKSLKNYRSASVSILEKPINRLQIRIRRDQFMETAKRKLGEKKQTRYSNFALPSAGVSHELFFVGKPKITVQQGSNQIQQLNTQLDIFQKKLFQKLK